MFSRFKGLMTLFAILCVAAIAGGSAHFYFGGKASDEKSISNKTEGADNTGGVIADNILENYEFGNDKDLNETYTYYFFPSTLYMTNDFFDSDTMPETVFGYNEVILDDNGDPVLDSNNQPQYKIVQDNITGISRNGETYKTYFSYLKNYLNSDTTTYLNSSSIIPNYNFYNKGTSSDKDSVNGNVYVYGSGIGGDGIDADDFHVQGYDTSMKDPYLLNNTEISSDLLLSNVSLDYYDEGKVVPMGGYNNRFYYFNKYNSVLNYANEVLSPIFYTGGDTDEVTNKAYDISLELTSEKTNIIKAYADYYQHGANSRLNSNSLEITSDKGRLRLGTRYVSDYLKGTIRDHSPFYYLNGAIHSYSQETLSEKPYLGTWFSITDDRDTASLTFLDNKTGYVYDDGGDHKVTFKYEVSGTEISISGNIRGTLQLNTSDPTSQMVNRAQYRNDRFGFWTAFYDWDDPKNWDDPNNYSPYIQNSASRYLPIKITVNGNLTPDDMAKVIPTLSASMFDKNMWADFSANVWTYVPYTYNSESEQYDFEYKELYTKGTDGFTAKDITYIFDIMQNPSKYADKDGNIRLFPVFSNGKNSDASDVSDGGGDAIQAFFSYASKSSPSIQNDMQPSSTKLTYSSYTYRGTNYGFYDYSVNYAVLKNVEIKKDKYESITFKIDTTYFDGKPHWGGHWIEVYTLDANYITDFVTTYGEGLYTFYLFLGNRGEKSSISNTEAFPDVNGKTLLENVVSYNDSSNELFNKYLISVLSKTWAQTTKGEGDQGDGSSVNTPNYSRPVALAVEKVTNLRLVSDIPIAEDENGEPKDEQNWTAIDNSIKQGLLNAKNFTIADEVYSIKEDVYNSDTINLPNDGKRIDSNNPYIYVIQNADFRFVNNLYFQIRFSNDYIANSMNVVTDYKYAPEGTEKYMAYSIQGQVIKFKFQHSDKDGDYFIQNVEAGSGENVRQGFKLKDYNARGIFDILLVSTGREGGKQSYNMYVNRHKNSFIKLFKGNPGTYEFKAEGTNQATNTFVSHKLPSEVSSEEEQDPAKDPTRNENSSLIWNGQTYLGEYLSTSTTGLSYGAKVDGEETFLSNNESFIGAIKRTIGVTPGLDNIYPIYDCVTGQQIAYYNSGVGRLFTSFGSGDGVSSDLELFTIMKNYVLYIGEPISRVI